MKWFIVYLFLAANAPNGMGGIVVDDAQFQFPDLGTCRQALVKVEKQNLHPGYHVICAGNTMVGEAAIRESGDVYIP
jgi:hypothetical protein